MRTRRCRYLVNTNFVIDLAEGDDRARDFAARNRGLLCASRLIFYELEARVDDPEERRALRRELRRALENYGVTLLPLTRSRLRSLFLRALEALSSLGVDPSTVSLNTIHDTIYALIAKEVGADLVTGDLAACRRAIRLGVCCIYTRAPDWTPRCR